MIRVAARVALFLIGVCFLFFASISMAYVARIEGVIPRQTAHDVIQALLIGLPILGLVALGCLVRDVVTRPSSLWLSASAWACAAVVSGGWLGLIFSFGGV